MKQANLNKSIKDNKDKAKNLGANKAVEVLGEDNMSALEKDTMTDIYFEPDYGKLYEEMENGSSETFHYSNEYGKVTHTFIKRKIETFDGEETWYDLTTPYGYGGPLVEAVSGKEDALIAGFMKDFGDYCKKNRIVSEFIRFHPIVANHQWFTKDYEVIYSRKTVGTNLKDFEDPFQSEFSKSCRKEVRRSLRDGVTYRITKAPEDISNFEAIYAQTMDRNHAADYYYFEPSYFRDCQKYFKNNILIVEALFEEKVVAMGFYFIYGDFIHMHLSGTLNEYLQYSPAYVLKYAVTLWGKEHGFQMIHHGGGKSSEPDDSLYLFKKKFGQHTEFDFHIGKKIWNQEQYDLLSKEVGIQETEFFPAYRDPEAVKK